MVEELNTNPTPATADAPVTPVPASSAGNVPLEMSPTIETIPAPAPAPEPIAPVEPTPAPVSPTPAPVTPPIEPRPTVPATAEATASKPSPAPQPVSPIRSLLDKAKAKIQFRKRAKLDKVVAKAKEQGSITNDQVEKLLRVSDATATRYLAELVREGRLRRVSAKGRGARYAPAQ